MVCDPQGRLLRWPKKVAQQEAVCAYLAKKFDLGASYSEERINAVLADWHTFNDWALLRRSMCDLGILERAPDGSRYWLADPGPTDSIPAS